MRLTGNHPQGHAAKSCQGMVLRHRKDERFAADSLDREVFISDGESQEANLNATFVQCRHLLIGIQTPQEKAHVGIPNSKSSQNIHNDPEETALC